MTKLASHWIIYRLILGLFLMGLSTPSQATDPKTKQYTMAGVEAAGASVSFGAAYKWLSVPEPTGVTKALAASGFVAGAGQLVLAGMGIDEARKMDDTSGAGNFTTPTTPTVPTIPGGPTGGAPRLPTGSRTSTNPNDYTLGQKVAAAYQAALVKKEETEKALKDLLGPEGPSIEELATNPEKYLTPEEMARLNEEKAKMEAELEERIANGDSSDLDSFLSSLHFSSISNQGGVFAPSFGEFNPSDFFKMTQLGIENSAPGYYGNMKLESLKPHSKKSLFERVSDKIKKIM